MKYAVLFVGCVFCIMHGSQAKRVIVISRLDNYGGATHEEEMYAIPLAPHGSTENKALKSQRGRSQSDPSLPSALPAHSKKDQEEAKKTIEAKKKLSK